MWVALDNNWDNFLKCADTEVVLLSIAAFKDTHYKICNMQRLLVLSCQFLRFLTRRCNSIAWGLGSLPRRRSIKNYTREAITSFSEPPLSAARSGNAASIHRATSGLLASTVPSQARIRPVSSPCLVFYKYGAQLKIQDMFYLFHICLLSVL